MNYLLFISISRGRGNLGSVLGGVGQGVRARVILVLREFTWNAHAVSLVPAFDDTRSLGSTLRQVVYLPGSMVPPRVTASRFLAGNKEAKLKPSTSSSLLLFRIFLSSSSPEPPAI